MAFSTQRNFVGVLDGTDVMTLNQKIDYKKTKLEERKQVVDNILEGTQFYSEYFSGFFKANINSGDHLSSDVNVCKSLERMANYLLNSDEIKAEEDADKVQYVFHTDEKYFQKKIDRERSIEALSEMDSENKAGDEAVIHFLKREEKNYKKDKNQFISTEDLKRDDFLGSVLRDYKTYEDFITAELKKDKSEFSRYLLTKIKGQLTNDMIYTKDHMLGIFGYDLKAFSESTDYNLDVFDFTNEIHLKGRLIETESGKRILAKGLLFFTPGHDPNSDFDHILWDLQDTIDKANLTDFEKVVLEESRNGATQEEIAVRLNTYQKKISRTIDVIARKVARVGNKYDAAGEVR